MDGKTQTSFIPKKPITELKSKSSGMSFFLFVSILIFLVSVGIAGWVYLEKQLLIRSITKDQETISTNKGSFDTATIDSIVELNSRINVAKGLLTSHVAISPIFNFLNQATLKNVRFRDFNFSSSLTDTTGQKIVGIKMNGTARDFETVASQADGFGKADWRNIIRETKVTNLNINPDGTVSFTLSATVLPDFLTYKAGTNQ